MQTPNPAASSFKKTEALAAAKAGKLEKNTLHAIIDNAARFGLSSEEIELFREALGRKNRRAVRIAEREQKKTENTRSTDLKPVVWSADKSDSGYSSKPTKGETDGYDSEPDGDNEDNDHYGY